MSSSDHTNWSYNEIPTWWRITGRWLSARLLGGDPFYAPSGCRLSSPNTACRARSLRGTTPRLEDTVGHDWDVKELMRAVMRIIAVAGTVEAQLQELGDVNDAGAPAQLRRSRESTPFMEQPESATAPSLSRQPSLNARAFAAPGSPPSREPSSKARS